MSHEREEDEGIDFSAAFKGQFGNMDAMKERLARERKAGRTPAQKARKGPPTKQKNFRLTLPTLAQIKSLGEKLGLDDTAVVTEAIDRWSKSELGDKK